jgi:copper resistance protein B
MKALLLSSIALLALAAPATAQSHQAHDQSMSGMAMPPAPADPHAEHGTQPAPDAPSPSGTDLPPGDAPAPPATHDRSADRFYSPDQMAAAEADMMGMHGGLKFHQLMFNLAEYQTRKGGDGYRWVAEGWYGGDINRLFVKTEGEGAVHGPVEAAEVQALYSRAIDPYWNLQLGVRQDIRPGPTRTYATAAIEGLAPYWFEAEAALFLSNKGDLLARAEAYYDQRLTQRLVLQPRAELNFAAQDVPENRIGAGLSSAELGLRLRYEIRREFAPYVGLSWERQIGRSARLARNAGDGTGSTSVVVGIRFWL